ncbi:MAG: hypothetical protein ACREP6_11385 [Candidatus Binataceae bacterium]
MGPTVTPGGAAAWSVARLHDAMVAWAGGAKAMKTSAAEPTAEKASVNRH